MMRSPSHEGEIIRYLFETVSVITNNLLSNSASFGLLTLCRDRYSLNKSYKKRAFVMIYRH